jgi:hypothetical protein
LFSGLRPNLRDGGGNSRERDNMQHPFAVRFLYDAEAPAGGGPASDGAGDHAGSTTPPEDAVVSFKQSELNKSYAERAKRAADKAVSDLLAGLGLKSQDDLKAIAKKAKDAEAAQLSEAEKSQKAFAEAQARIAELEAQHAQALAESKTLRIRSAVEVAAAALKFHKPEDAYLLADVAAITIGDDGKVSGVEAVLKDLAKARPYLINGQEPVTEIDATRRSNGNAPALTDAEKRELAARYGVDPRYI